MPVRSLYISNETFFLTLKKSNLVNSFSNRQKPQFEDEAFVETVWLKFLPWRAVTAHCPLFSVLLDSPVDWGQHKMWEYWEKKKGRREVEAAVFKENILVQAVPGHAVIWFETSDNLPGCRRNNKSEGLEGDRGFWNQHCH